jgi:hypothetical protein
MGLSWLLAASPGSSLKVRIPDTFGEAEDEY